MKDNTAVICIRKAQDRQIIYTYAKLRQKKTIFKIQITFTG